MQVEIKRAASRRDRGIGRCATFRDFLGRVLAESEGFEPPKRSRACWFSRPVQSTALPTLRFLTGDPEKHLLSVCRGLNCITRPAYYRRRWRSRSAVAILGQTELGLADRVERRTKRFTEVCDAT